MTRQPVLIKFFLPFVMLTGCLDIHAQWIGKNNGLYGGNVDALAAIGTTLFAGTLQGGGAGVYHGGIFRSTDNGTSWIPVNTGLPNASINTLAVNGATLFAGTDGGGVARSNDNGANWTTVNTGLTNLSVLSLMVSGANLFAGTYGGGIFLSTNNGASWTAMNTGLSSMYVFSLTAMGSSVFAGTNGGVYLSTDNGNTWANVNTGLPSFAFIYSLTAIGSTLLAGTDQAGVFQSTDNGGQWTAANTGLTLSSLSSVKALTVSGSNVFAGTNKNGVFVSANSGGTWTAISTGLTSISVSALAVNGTNVFAGTANGVFASADNGANWATASTGITDANVYSIAQNGSSLFAATSGGGIFRSTDNATSWTTVNTGLTSLAVPALIASGGNLFAGTGANVFRSTDNGATWTAANNGMTSFMLFSALTASGSNLFAGTWGGGVFLSTDNATTWTAVNTGLTNLNIYYVSVINGKLYAGTNGGLFVSPDNGTSWTAVTNGLPATAIIRSMVISGSTIFAGGYGSGIYKSSDNGVTWSLVNTGLTNLNVESFTLNGSDLLVATYGGGIFRSTDSGTTWAAVNTGLPNAYVRWITLTGSDFLIGTDGSGVWGRAANLAIMPPTITSFTPGSGPVGTTVTIAGTNFDLTPANNTVQFNGTTAVVASSTAISITTTVPVGASTGNITVTVGANTATSADNFTVTPYNTPFGNAIQLNGSDNYVNFGNKTAFNFTGAFTVETWIQANDPDKQDWVAVITKGDHSWRLQRLQHGATGFTMTFSTTGLSNIDMIGNIVITDQGWHHFAAVYTGTEKYLFVDGVLDVSTSVTGSLGITTDPLYLGANIYDPSNDRFFNGDMDEVRLWNIARSQCDIQSTINTTLTGNEAGLVAYYKLDETGQGGGITVANSATSTGTSPNGTTVGTGTTPAFQFSGVPFSTPTQVTISSFTPASGIVGTSVTIIGTNFSTTPTDNVVTFNGTTSEVTASTATSISTIVPAGATTGTVSVTVGCHTATNTDQFTVTVNPIIFIAAQPSDATVCDGTTAQFSTNASGTSNMVFQWQFATSGAGPFTGINNGGGYSGATTKVLSVNTTGNFGAGFYQCKVDGDFAATVFTNSAGLIINPVPSPPQVIIPAPSCNPSAVDLTASGGANGQYVWYTVPSGGIPIGGQTNSTYTTPALSTTTTYYVSSSNGNCESTRTPIIATVQDCHAPAIASTVETAFIEGIMRVDLTNLISDPDNNLDTTSLTITQPESGAIASRNGFILTIDYTGRPYAAADHLSLKACDLTSLCTTQQITIEFEADIKVYNAVSPNGDGLNEFLFLQNIEVIPATQQNRVDVYSRWGDEVFSINDYNNQDRVFSGYSNGGNKLPAGTYYYKISFTSGAAARKGYLELKY